jgi:hypothetical protein
MRSCLLPSFLNVFIACAVALFFRFLLHLPRSNRLLRLCSSRDSTQLNQPELIEILSDFLAVHEQSLSAATTRLT